MALHAINVDVFIIITDTASYISGDRSELITRTYEENMGSLEFQVRS